MADVAIITSTKFCASHGDKVSAIDSAAGVRAPPKNSSLVMQGMWATHPLTWGFSPSDPPPWSTQSTSSELSSASVSSHTHTQTVLLLISNPHRISSLSKLLPYPIHGVWGSFNLHMHDVHDLQKDDDCHHQDENQGDQHGCGPWHT